MMSTECIAVVTDVIVIVLWRSVFIIILQYLCIFCHWILALLYVIIIIFIHIVSYHISSHSTCSPTHSSVTQNPSRPAKAEDLPPKDEVFGESKSPGTPRTYSSLLDTWLWIEIIEVNTVLASCSASDPFHTTHLHSVTLNWIRKLAASLFDTWNDDKIWSSLDRHIGVDTVLIICPGDCDETWFRHISTGRHSEAWCLKRRIGVPWTSWKVICRRSWADCGLTGNMCSKGKAQTRDWCRYIIAPTKIYKCLEHYVL